MDESNAHALPVDRCWHDVYCIFDNTFHVRRVNSRWRWEGDGYQYGNHFSPWYSLEIEPSLELFAEFVKNEAGLNQT